MPTLKPYQIKAREIAARSPAKFLRIASPTRNRPIPHDERPGTYEYMMRQEREKRIAAWGHPEGIDE